MAEPLIEPPDPPGSRWLFAFFLALPLLLAAIPRDLWQPEEPRFGRCAHEMAAEGDWLVTRLNGFVDAEKPPLLFWMMAGVEKVIGAPTPFGMRLPGALLASLAILATARLARRWFGDRGLARTAAILFAATPLILWNAPRVGMDLGLAAFSILALEGATAAILDASWGGVARLGVGLGLGLLLKGPHVLYVPLCGAAAGGWALRRGSASEPRPNAGPAFARVAAGVVLGAAIFAAWLVPALALRGSEVIDTGITYQQRLVGQLGSRVSGAAEPHRHGPLFLWPILLLAGLPWIVFAGMGVVASLREPSTARAERFGTWAAIGAVLLPMVLLSIPGSKRETYLVPLLPCVAILAATALHRRGRERPVLRATQALAPFLALLAVGAALGPVLGPRLLPGDRYDVFTGRDLATGPALVACLIVAIGLAIGARFAWKARAAPDRAARITALSLALAVLAGSAFFLPRFDPAMSFADAATVAKREAPLASYAYAGTADPSSLWAMGFSRATQIVEYAPLVARLAPDAPKALVLAKGRFWTDRTNPQRKVAAADLAALERVRVLWERRVGGETWHLLTNALP